MRESKESAPLALKLVAPSKFRRTQAVGLDIHSLHPHVSHHCPETSGRLRSLLVADVGHYHPLRLGPDRTGLEFSRDCPQGRSEAVLEHSIYYRGSFLTSSQNTGSYSLLLQAQRGREIVHVVKEFDTSVRPSRDPWWHSDLLVNLA